MADDEENKTEDKTKVKSEEKNEHSEKKVVTTEKESIKDMEEKKDIASGSSESAKTDYSVKGGGLSSGLESTAEAIQEPKVKKSFREKLRWGNKKEKQGKNQTEGSKGASPDDVAEEIYRNLAEIKGNEYVLFRMKKKTLLIVLGIVILLMWLIPLSKWAIESYAPQYVFWNPELAEQATTPSIEEVEEVEKPVEEVFRIRIRNNSEVENAAQYMSELLKENGFEYVEVVDDFESDYEGVFIVTKSGDEESREKVAVILSERYELASPSAELTDDSDFQVVILFGLTTPIETSTFSANISTRSADLN